MVLYAMSVASESIQIENAVASSDIGQEPTQNDSSFDSRSSSASSSSRAELTFERTASSVTPLISAPLGDCVAFRFLNDGPIDGLVE